MTIEECNIFIIQNRHLVGKQIKYNDEIYDVLDIFPYPTDKTKITFFNELYIKQGKSLNHALNGTGSLTDRTLEVVLYCSPIIVSEIKFIRLSDEFIVMQ